MANRRHPVLLGLIATLAAVAALAGAASAVVPGPNQCSPSGFEAAPVGGVVNLSWNETAGASQYNIYRQWINATSPGPLQLAIVVQAPASGTVDTQVIPGDFYLYQGRAVVDGVEQPGCEPKFVQAAGDCAPHVSATVEDASIHLAWTAVPAADAYRIERATGDGEFVLLAQVDAGVQSHADSDVVAGQAYRYAVRLVVDGQVREACNVVEATAVPFFPGFSGILAGVATVGLCFLVRRRAP